MRKSFSKLLLIALLITGQVKAQSLKNVIDKAFQNAQQQSLLMAKKYENQAGRLPKSFENGKDVSSDSRWWCSGFFQVRFGTCMKTIKIRKY